MSIILGALGGLGEAGMQMAQKEGDQVITSYRDHGHMLACGMDAKGVMAELTRIARALAWR